MTSRTLAKKIAEFAHSKKAFDVVMMDLRKLRAPSDFFIVCSADSDTHVKAIADAVRVGTEEIGVSLWHSEGFRSLTWVLLDYVDVVVHVFKKDVRPFYNLERLWGDAKLIPVEDIPPALGVPGSVPGKRTRKSAVRRAKKTTS
ncbi:MAG: ribosome silencing factor [Bacteroidota bacterium]